MSDRQVFVLAHEEARRRAIAAVENAPTGHVVRISPATRSLESNALMWSRLNDIAEQVEWYGRRLDAEAFKHIFTAALSKQDVVPNLDGTGFVVLGKATSSMTKGEMSDLIALIDAFGDERGVRWALGKVAA